MKKRGIKYTKASTEFGRSQNAAKFLQSGTERMNKPGRQKNSLRYPYLKNTSKMEVFLEIAGKMERLY